MAPGIGGGCLVHAQLARSIANSPTPPIDGRVDRPATDRSDAVPSFIDLLQPTDVAVRLSASFGRRAMSTEAALSPPRPESSRPDDNTRPGDRIARRRTEPGRDDVDTRSDGNPGAPDANAPANSGGSAREPVAAEPSRDASAG